MVSMTRTNGKHFGVRQAPDVDALENRQVWKVKRFVLPTVRNGEHRAIRRQRRLTRLHELP